MTALQTNLQVNSRSKSLTNSQAKLKFTQVTPRTWSTVGSTGNVYTLNLFAGALSCDCLAGKHLRTCYHIDRLAQLFKADLNEALGAPQPTSAIDDENSVRFVVASKRCFPP
jgi:hypothetical protein